MRRNCSAGDWSLLAVDIDNNFMADISLSMLKLKPLYLDLFTASSTSTDGDIVYKGTDPGPFRII